MRSDYYYDNDNYFEMIQDARADAAQEQHDKDYKEAQWSFLEYNFVEMLSEYAELQALPFAIEGATFEQVKAHEPFTKWVFEKYADDIEEYMNESYAAEAETDYLRANWHNW